MKSIKRDGSVFQVGNDFGGAVRAWKTSSTSALAERRLRDLYPKASEFRRAKAARAAARLVRQERKRARSRHR